MGTYLLSLQKSKSIKVKLADGSDLEIAQTKYLCRAGQECSTDYNSEKRMEVLRYPQLQGAISRIEKNLGDYSPQMVSLSYNTVGKRRVEEITFQKIKNSISSHYYDDRPHGVENDSLCLIKTSKGYVIHNLSAEDSVFKLREMDEIWNKEFDRSVSVKINKNYTASCRSLRSLFEYLVDYGRDATDFTPYVIGETKGFPAWFIIGINAIGVITRGLQTTRTLR